MSASSGLLAKGEKGKSKFQSLDINNLYKSTENEPTQHRGSLLRNKNGMQSLGKVPTARRPPANLPSLKSEKSGTEPAVSLVPAGAAGWGSKPGETPPPSQQQPAAPAAAMPPTAPPLAPAPVAVVTPVLMVPPPPHEQALHNLMPGPDKSWSAIMAREQVPNFLAHQSPQFQQEFPKLASEGGQAVPAKPVDAQYGPGPSLRPQTEGSWTTGGGRALSAGGVGAPAGAGPMPAPGPLAEPARSNLGPPVAQHMGPAGPVPSMPINFPHGGGYRPMQHPFMMGPRGGYPGAHMAGGLRPRFPYPGGRAPPNEGDEPLTRPIIRDEELNKMDEIARDPGWAANEDIDYNEKLAFSDGEDGPGDAKKRDVRRGDKGRGKEDNSEKPDNESERRSEERSMEKRNDWGRPRYTSGPSDDERRKMRELDEEKRKSRDIDDRKFRDTEEMRKARDTDEDKRKVREEIAGACQVARLRKEDEAKRFDEAKRAREWEETGSNKRDGHDDRDGKSDQKMSYDGKRDDHVKIEERENRRDDRENRRDDRDNRRDDRDRMDDRRDYRQNRNSQFNKLPPRLQAQANRMNPHHRQTNSPQPAGGYDQHWVQGRRYGGDAPDDRHTDSYNDRYKGSRDRHPDSDRRHFDRKDRESDSDRHNDDSYKKPRETELPPRLKESRKEPSEEREAWRMDEDRRPQRPESRDSRASRDSRSSREDKHEKPRLQDVRREEVKSKEVPAFKDGKDEKEKQLAASHSSPKESTPTPASATETPAASTETKVDKDEKPAAVSDDGRAKGGKSPRGGRWGGSAPTNSTTYVRNGANRGERRRRVSGPKAEESGSSCGSELDKGEKEERNRETKRTDGFAPSGQPSRRGRGATRVRGGSTAPRRMDGYGPPPVKASFPNNEPPAVEEEEEDPTKQKQAALNAGIVGGAARAAAATAATAPAAAKPDAKATTSAPAVRPQRTQSQRDANRGGKSVRPTRRSGDDWESNSDGEERRGDPRPRRGGAVGGARGPPRSAPRPQPVKTLDGKEEKPVDAAKPKSESETEASQVSNASQENRVKKEFPKKEGAKPVKPDGPTRAGPPKDRERPERRAKPLATPAPNPNGPQPLMSQVVNPPPQMKNYGNNTWRQNTLPPRLQKQQEQRQQSANLDPAEYHKPNTVFPAKSETAQPRENAWDKPLGPRPAAADPVQSAEGASSPANKPRVDAHDDVTPVNTIIFENTNLKAAVPSAFTGGLKPGAGRVSKGNEWKPGDELFPKGGELSGSESVVAEHKTSSLYHTDHGLGLLNSELSEMTEENEAGLKHRLAGTKTLWDQNEDDQQPGGAVFPGSFCPDPSIDGGFGKVDDVPDDCTGLMHGEVVYNPASQQYGMSKHDNSSSNVCKVKPQQQPVLSGVSGHSPLGHPSQSPLSLAHASQSPLSPPPFSSTQGQFSYQQQAGLSGSAAPYSGISAIPSPPAGHPYTSQPLQTSSGLYAPFQLDRQFSTQFTTPYGLSAGLGGALSFNQTPLYPTHGAPPSNLFSQYRVQQHPTEHTNPNTVLMSSTNSLMSANVKQPSSQNIGVIGSKGPAFQQSNQMFIPYEAMSFLSGSGLVQRPAPVQPPSGNFYSNSGPQQTGFYSTPNTGLGQALPNMPQTYNRTGFVNQSTNLQSYSSQQPVHMDMGYRNTGAVGPASYLKSGMGNASVSQPDVLASVFNTAPPKARPPKQMNQPPPQQSPTQSSVNKFPNYSNQLGCGPQQRMSNMGLSGMRNAPRYPTPIQRPMGNRGPLRPQRPPPKTYYDTQDGKLDEVNDLNTIDEPAATDGTAATETKEVPVAASE